MKKLIFLLILPLFLACCSDSPLSDTVSSSETESQTVSETDTPIVFEENAYLRIVGDPVKGLYSDFVLSYNGAEKEFSGSMAENNRDPQCIVNDVNGDGSPEIIVILNTGYGPGINQEELHVFNSKDLSEYECADIPKLLRYISNFDVDSEKYTGTVLGCTFEIPKKDLSVSVNEPSDTITAQNIHRYSVKNSQICCTFSCQISPSEIIGELDIYLSLSQNGVFVCDRAEFRRG